MKADITFDTVVADVGQPHIEGCYRLEGRDWQVFYFTSRWQGRNWKGAPEIIKNAVWRSGVTGIEVHCQDDEIINKAFVRRILSEVLGVAEWTERFDGPDSL
jgi:hypothetical protein